ncbi:ParB/RepB/Spo0J family partition protein [Pantoea vagans]|uniref:ParB/RepB/Spo0J family partition protein n=1 Tax=Pantoea vagans TaxID=470934 RepID=UPI0023AF91C8|nr:ParB/RepB/Spo0J family partition protein [Pantoea vagans]MDE8559375.1 ParB/RepB/Spo0J family partition protein [Pantoea vagans]MDE8579370.1 ParB/RepB/Spo0J family partition protein [Pantoea vagans]
MAASKFQKKLNALKTSGPAVSAMPEVAASVAARNAPAPVGTPEASKIRAEIARPGLEPDGQIVRVRADEIYELEQVRPEDDFDEEVISGMVESFSELGNLTPPRCFPKDRKGYRVWFGATRIRSMKKRGDEFIDIYVGRPPKDEKQRIMGQLIENLQQSGLKPLATALAFEQLKTDFNMTGEEIARSLGKPTAFVSKHIRIGSAPEKIKALLKNKSISDVDLAYTLIQIDNIDSGASDRLIEKHNAGSTLTRAQVKKELDRLKGRDVSKAPTKISHAKSQSGDDVLQPDNETVISHAKTLTTESGSTSSRDKKNQYQAAAVQLPLIPVVKFNGTEVTVLLHKMPDEFGFIWLKTAEGELYVRASDVEFLGLRSE